VEGDRRPFSLAPDRRVGRFAAAVRNCWTCVLSVISRLPFQPDGLVAGKMSSGVTGDNPPPRGSSIRI
jgi:hypothetical protein